MQTSEHMTGFELLGGCCSMLMTSGTSPVLSSKSLLVLQLQSLKRASLKNVNTW
jgi:hypothetical protein